MDAKNKSDSADGLDRRDLIALLGHERELMQHILGGLSEGVVFVDSRAAITFANPAARLMLAWREDCLGGTLKSCMRCHDGNTLPFLESNGSLSRSLKEGDVLSGIEKITSKTRA